ncbi:uncharacterized protein BDV17DRAFT_288745 [Aspergillus undulatus]|uniref:uncharacterized protein n=1 Tax=Aspergillus undulatus TaxID=1810928 RepID=UPI003CCC9DA8
MSISFLVANASPDVELVGPRYSNSPFSLNFKQNIILPGLSGFGHCLGAFAMGRLEDGLSCLRLCGRRMSHMVAPRYTCACGAFSGSLFIAQTLIFPTGAILLHCHKTKSTHIERALFGEGSGDSIRNVVPTPLGNIGALQCWEHTYAQNEHLHIAGWPTCQAYVWWEPWSFCTEAAIKASRIYATDSGAFTIVATQCHTQRSLDQLITSTSANAKDSTSGAEEVLSHMAQIGGGFAAVYAPDGKKLTRGRRAGLGGHSLRGL